MLEENKQMAPPAFVKCLFSLTSLVKKLKKTVVKGVGTHAP
jgi:hypothetical protein